MRVFLSAIVVSLLLGVVAVIAAVGLSRPLADPIATARLRILSDPSASLTPGEAQAALFSDSSAKRYAASSQPDGHFWIGLEPLQAQTRPERPVLELRMLRASELRFWALDAGDLVPLELQARNDKGGISVKLDGFDVGNTFIVGSIIPKGVGRPKVFLWSQDAYDDSVLLFERGGGALLGSFIMLAIFSAFVGAVNRDWSFFLFAGWLITTLRVASINDGWDLTWLGISLDNELLLMLMRVSLAAHALLTISLFRSLLASELERSKLSPWLAGATALFAALVVASPFLRHAAFLPALWVSAALGILLILTSLTLVVLRTRSSVAFWYTGSWCATFIGVLTEVGYASGLISQVVPGLNSQTASVTSALVTAIALAEKLRVERLGRLAAQREKFDVLEKFKRNYDSMPVGLFSMTRLGSVTLFNPAFAKMFGIQGTRLRHDSSVAMETLLGENPAQRLVGAIDTAGPLDLEFNVDTDDGQRRWFQSRVTANGDAIEGSIQDVTARKEAESRLRHLVDHDSLTGLLNRHGLEEAMKSAAEAARRGLPCAIAHVDLDRFKLINDLYGHATGDAMIQEASTRLLSTVRSRDFVARIADSFVILLLDCPDRAVVRLTERLRESIGEHPFELEGKSLTMTVSVGVTSLDPEMPPIEAMAAANRACAEAKSRGRNCVVRLDEGDDALTRHLEELKVVADLQKRLPIDRYFLEMQPIVSLRSALTSLNYEVLLRMHDERGGVIPPGKFIGAAERNGLMSQIDRWVIKTTLQWLDAHPEHRERLTFATINISGSSLNDARFVDDAVSMIREHPLSVNKLCFEITESIALHDLESTRRFVDRLRSYGSKLALDDFGAGYTSFSYLKEIPADFIKIDGSFVRDINVNPANYAITRTIVDLTHELGMRSIAEWAETPDTVASLIELRVDYGQGYGLARPMHTDLLAGARSSGALVRDPQVLAMLDTSAMHLLAAQPTGARRH